MPPGQQCMIERNGKDTPFLGGDVRSEAFQERQGHGGVTPALFLSEFVARRGAEIHARGAVLEQAATTRSDAVRCGPPPDGGVGIQQEIHG